MTGADNQNGPAGTQTLFRALGVIEAVARGATNLKAIGAAIGCTRSTTHRVVSALVRAECIQQCSHGGYRLGAKLIEFGLLAREQMPLTAVAHRHLESLAARTRYTVHLGIAGENEVLYIDEIPGAHAPLRARIGRRMPAAFVSIGKALMLDRAEVHWREQYDIALERLGAAHGLSSGPPDWPVYLDRMRLYAESACVFDCEDHEDGSRCISAPIRDAHGAIIASLGIAGTGPSLSELRVANLCADVIATATAISTELGWISRHIAAISLHRLLAASASYGDAGIGRDQMVLDDD